MAASAAGAAYAGEADPYRKPHEADELDDEPTTSPTRTPTTVSTEAPAGLVVVDKPAGMTSHDVVARIRRLAGTRKVGHAGTLDPMATGVLLVGVNRATRLLGHLTLTEKAYDATVRLGATHHHRRRRGGDAHDRVGRARSPRTTSGRPRAAFVGDLEQMPSAVSAIKVDGKRAYARVRDGEDVDLPARPVTVHELLVTDVRPAGDVARRRRLGALQQRHLHPGDRPRPRRRARRRRPPHRAAPHGGRAVHARRGARPSTPLAERLAARRRLRRGPALLPVATTSTRTQARDVGFGRKLADRSSASRRRWRCSRPTAGSSRSTSSAATVAAPVAVFA